ncbi:MAG: argininosuccinate synthase [Limnochordaceae bacterium]|nr:argininosuccinate synthase [Limnochordaceae bacterium]
MAHAHTHGAQKVNKVVLAYSGGLDTSIIIPWLKENYGGCQVIAMVGDVGQGDDMAAVKAKALASGADEVYVEDLRTPFLTDYVFPMLRSGAVYERKYLLGTSIARPIIAKRQAELALQLGADAVAHGCTGKGNDQVRFELTYKAFAPHLRVIAPWREWSLRSREEEIDYAQARGIPVPVTKAKPYSMDQNLWHTSYEGGVLEDPWQTPPEDMFTRTVDPRKAPDTPLDVEIRFENGCPVAVDGVALAPVPLLERLNDLAGAHGVGRVDIVENRLVGMKSRGVYETPGGTLLYTAWRELEELTLDRESLHYKDLVALKYAELVYYGQWWTPLRQALDAFISSLTGTISGTVRLRLFKGSCTVVGRKAEHSLYQQDLATFGADEVYRQADAAGFINLFGLPLAVQARVWQGQPPHQQPPQQPAAQPSQPQQPAQAQASALARATAADEVAASH